MMEIGFMLSETFIVNSIRFDDEMRLVLKEFTSRESIEIPQKHWSELVALCPDICLAVNQIRGGECVNFHKSFGDNFYAKVTSVNSASVILYREASEERIRIGFRYWDQLLNHLPELMSAIPHLFETQQDFSVDEPNEVQLLRNQLDSETRRREEIEHELELQRRKDDDMKILIKMQCPICRNVYANQYSKQRHMGGAIHGLDKNCRPISIQRRKYLRLQSARKYVRNRDRKSDTRSPATISTSLLERDTMQLLHNQLHLVTRRREEIERELDLTNQLVCNIQFKHLSRISQYLFSVSL
jgi:hypothetical protein